MWKSSRVVLLEKPKKGEDHTVKYRPVCLLDAAGKRYEILLNSRLTKLLEDGDGKLSPNQHGFRKNHSTVSAVESVLAKAVAAHRGNQAWCLLTLMDIRNAFNTASWPGIIDALARVGAPPYMVNVIKDYLNGRSIQTRTSFRREYRVGVPQGSVFGPTLWNVLYDEIFNLRLPNGVSLVGYADDIAVVSEHKVWETTIRNTELTAKTIDSWLTSIGLQLAPEKTESVALKYGRRRREGSIQIGGCDIEIVQAVKYLGVVLDTSISHQKLKYNPSVGGKYQQRYS